ncbi:TetR family transcriptional regulator [Actinomycetospora endophytica]|uniref:TetR family transcriptional regulator n=1 Tax=Actinomycetospora endophytica TaxID=2291215 RepID=A0ABS8P9N6_9PSEU|nr:TetR family transcriptional regulator [Actinomycetospora endophytica]MCD2194728.1 TetR family transcriptional regulator [Actinomycetospora endophytica]
MPRPSRPILSRDSIVEGALRIMDRDGFSGFTLPRLGHELGVRTPSLYYHFRDRAELLSGVARGIVEQTALPPTPTEGHWDAWFVELAVNFRRAALRHSNAVPVLLQFLPHDVMTDLYENAAALLDRSGDLDPTHRLLLLEGLEKLTIGAIVVEALRASDQPRAFDSVDPATHPRLAEAGAQSADAEDLFRQTARTFVRGVRNPSN